MLTLLLAFAIADLPSWVASEGGRVEKNEAGQIVAVDLSSTWITDADLERIGQIKSLRKLNLAHTKITDVGIEHLEAARERRRAQSLLRRVHHRYGAGSSARVEAARSVESSRSQADQPGLRESRSIDIVAIARYRVH